MRRPASAAPPFVLSAIAAAALLILAGNVAAQSFPSEVENIFPLAPRELRQRLARAQSAVAEERFSDAVAEIGEILNSTGSDDFFLGAVGTPDAQLSLKTEALALLGGMPVKGRRMYELQFGADAKVALESALAGGDLAQLMEVSRRYFHTKAGYEATLLLGRVQLDQGRPLAAALTLKRVADVPTALAQYDPELSVLLATCWIHANQPAEAEASLLDLKKRLPQARVKLVDREAALFQRDAGALDWLREIVGGSRAAFASAATQWTVYRGDEKRNAQSTGGVPLLNFNWKLPTVNDPADEARVAQLLRSLRDNSEQTVISVLQPLVVRDYAIVRQPESSKLVGINLTKHGKREWVYPPFDESPMTQAAREAIKTGRGPMANNRERELRERIWEDNAFGQVSSDGQQVYLLDDLSLAGLNGVNVPPVGVGRGGILFPNSSATKSHNLLVALDLARQGYQVWAVGGTTGDNPALAGAFFLGPPLPVGDQLYALAEVGGEIRLVCLDSRSGGLEWKQQLAVLEQSSISGDPSRRLAGATPSLAEGILVCPTSAGAVVAIDLSTRTLRWGYQYRRHDVVTQLGRPGMRNMLQTPGARQGSHWIDGTATLADGCVVLTPPESQELHCLDLLTGKSKWAPIPREDMLLVACIHEGKIILLGKNRVKAINLADGKAAWSQDVSLNGETTVGRGYYSEHYYYLPISGQQLCKIDLNLGQIESRAQTEVELGNLVCYKDQLISLSPQSVTSFVLLNEQLEKQLGERLAANANDLEALSLQAQILFQGGKAHESLALLRRAVTLAPERGALQGLLAKVMLALVRQDLAAHGGLTDELITLVSDAGQRREVLRLRLQWLVQGERKWDAFQAIAELADQEIAAAGKGQSGTSPALQNVERERSVRADRWLHEQLRVLLASADPTMRERIHEHLQNRLAQVLAGGNLHELRMFLSLFGAAEVATATKVALLDRLLAAEALLEAELIAGSLLKHPDRSVAATAVARLANVYQQAKRPELVVAALSRLEGEFGEVLLAEGRSGREIARQLRGQKELPPLVTKWPLGVVEVQQAEANGGWQQRAWQPLVMQHFSGSAPRGLRVSFDAQRSDLVVRAESGRILANASLRNAEAATRRSGIPLGSLGSPSGQANGHLVIVHLGADVAAVDGLRAERTNNEALLWRQEAIEEATAFAGQRVMSSSRLTRNPLLGNRNNSYEPFGRMSFATGPVTDRGVVFQRGRQIVCVDPLTGAVLWERGTAAGAEIPQQAELFGDDEVVLVADERVDSKSLECLVLSASDGSLLGKRTLSTADKRWATCGRNALVWEEQNSFVQLELYDVVANRLLWSRRVASGARADILDGEELAVLEPNGQLSLVSLATGSLLFAVPLEPGPPLAWVHLLASRDQYLLLTSQNESQGNGGLSPLTMNAAQAQVAMHGRVYAFDRATGKLQWPAAAFVSQHWLPPEQPTESPLLFFVAQRQGNNKAAAAILALDRRTGETVFDSDLAGAMSHCEIAADLAKQNVTVILNGQGQSQRTVTFQFTDKPRPPQPPAQLGEMASRTAGRPAGRVDPSLGDAILGLQNRNALPPAAVVPLLPGR